MTGPSNAGQARHADEAMRTFLQADGRTGLNPREAIIALLTSLRHYADRQGTHFGDAVSASGTDYARHRQNEEHAYAIGQEIRLRTRAVLSPPLASLPARGTVQALYPGSSGMQMYAIQFPAEANPVPFTGNEIEPAPAFPHLHTSRGVVVTSLIQAEDLLTAAVTRIREQQIRNLPPGQADIADRRTLSIILGEVCDLPPGDILTQFEHQVAGIDGFHALAAASQLGRWHGNAGIRPLGKPGQHGDDHARLLHMLDENDLAADGNRARRAAIVAAYRDAHDEAKTGEAFFVSAGPTGSTARPAARDFPDQPGGHAVPDTSGDVGAAASYRRRTPGADRLPGPRRNSQ